MTYLWKRKHHDSSDNDRHVVQIKSKFDTEFRRFSIPKPSSVNEPTKENENEGESVWSFEAFRLLVIKLHRLPHEIPFNLFYTDPSDGDLLPINNNENFRLALIRSNPLLRLHVTRADELFGSGRNMGVQPMQSSRFLFFGHEETSGFYKPASSKASNAIGRPSNFRHISTLIDADQLPPSQRRVRLRKSQADGRPLGFCIRDGWNLRTNAQNEPDRRAGIFISRLIPGGLAESTGLLSVNDEILEVNGIFIGDGAKSLDQVTDMMVANAADLIITIRTPDIIDGNQMKLLEPPKNQQHFLSVSAPNTPDNTLNRKKKARGKRMEVASSVFYVDSDEGEDTVITFIST